MWQEKYIVGIDEVVPHLHNTTTLYSHLGQWKCSSVTTGNGAMLLLDLSKVRALARERLNVVSIVNVTRDLYDIHTTDIPAKCIVCNPLNWEKHQIWQKGVVYIHIHRMVYLALELHFSKESFSSVCICTRPVCQVVASSKKVAVLNLKENVFCLMEISIYVFIVLFGLVLTSRQEFLGFVP